MLDHSHQSIVDSLSKVNEEIRLLQIEKIELMVEIQEECPFTSAAAAAKMLNIGKNSFLV